MRLPLARLTFVIALTGTFVLPYALLAAGPGSISAGPAGAGSSASGPGGPRIRLKIAEFDPLVALPALPTRLTLGAEPAAGIFVVQFTRPIAAETLARLRGTGATDLEYLPDQAYIVRLPAGTPAQVRALPEVRWLGALEPGWKLAPDLGTRPLGDPSRREGGRLYATADLFAGEDPEQTAAAARAAGAEVIQVLRFGAYARLKLRASLTSLEQVARIPGVSWIEELGEIVPRNNTTRWVIQTNVLNSTTVWDHGVHGEGQIVGHIDGNIDMNSCFFKDLVNNTPGPSHRKVVAYRSSTGLGTDLHGTHTAGTAAGDQFPINGTLDEDGNAYAARISHSNLNDITGSGAQPSNLYNYLTAAHNDGARVHTNSWGDDGTRAYTTWSVDIDRFSYDHEDSLVMFAVSNGSISTTPENAKDCIGVGASVNGSSDGNFCSGGRGPTQDGRRKPELFAPGCSIISARANTACSTTSLTGTSMASPAVTAAAALVNQYYSEGWYPSGTKSPGDARTPTGALVKATLLNSAVDMTGIVGYPSDQEGWGRVLLENALYFSGDARKLSVLDDVRNASGLTTGGVATYPLTVQSSGQSLHVTLAWTEPAASLLAASATINNLDLEVVSPSGATYLGNVFDTSAGFSITGGVADALNNLEQVAIAAPEAGDWTVRIRGKTVNQAAQGFALVASGDVKPASAGVLRYAGNLIQDAPPLGNNDGTVDPGETVTMPVSLKNSGTATVTGIGGGITSDTGALVKITRDAASWPDLVAGGTAGSNPPHYRFTVSPATPCGAHVTFRVATTSSDGDGATGFGVDVGKSHADYPAAGLPRSIPKKSSSGVTSTISVPDAFTIRDANVFVDIGHQDVGELVVTLRSPQGTAVTLHNMSHAGTADIVTTYDRDRQPDGPGTMNDFNGQQAQGTWTLTVVDNVGGGTPAGSLRGFTVELDATSPISCSPLSCADPVPAEVGGGLLLRRENAADLRLDWPAVPGASSYRIWRSATPDFSHESLVGTSTQPTFLQAGELASPVTWFYEVRAANSCEWEGP